MENRPSDTEGTLARDFYEFRRDAYAYRIQVDENLKEAIEGIRGEARTSVRWAIGVSVVVLIALGGMLKDWAISYADAERTLDKIVERVDGQTKHDDVQDRTLESLNERVRVLEQIENKYK